MMKLFNFTLGRNATTPNIEEESVILRQFVCVLCACKTICVCVFLFLFKKKKKLETMCKKDQPKKIMH